jgi:hypothetical protein
MSKRIRVKPSKGESLAGFIGGIIFCCIGLFVAIPTFGIFGVLWSFIAILITASHGYNAFSNKGIPSHEIFIDDTSESKVTYMTPEDRLNELQNLLDKNLITEDEFQEKRKQIINDI